MLKLAVKNLIVPLGKEVSQLVSFSLERGEGIRIQGESGAGKTSLLECLCGLRKPISGSMYWLPDQGVRIGYAPQDEILYDSMTVRHQLELFAKFQGVPVNVSVTEVERLAQVFGFSRLLERSPKELSGGQRKRVLLARSLLGEPECIMLDEVFVGLDRQAALQLSIAFIKEVQKWQPILITVEHGHLFLEEYINHKFVL